MLERFSHTPTLASSVQGGFFLRKKPLGSMASEYSNGRTALADVKGDVIAASWRSNVHEHAIYRPDSDKVYSKS
jgi:hypothetical protein